MPALGGKSWDASVVQVPLAVFTWGISGIPCVVGVHLWTGALGWFWEPQRPRMPGSDQLPFSELGPHTFPVLLWILPS